MISIRDLHDFFEQIGFHWLGIIDNVYEFPYEPFRPKDFDRLVFFAEKYEQILSYIFKDGRKTTEHYFKINYEVFEEYLYDGDSGYTKGQDYTEKWLEFQEELNKKYKKFV